MARRLLICAGLALVAGAECCSRRPVRVAQGAAAAAAAPPPAPPRGRRRIDITGYWVALVTDDWRYRMLTPPKGNAD